MFSFNVLVHFRKNNKYFTFYEIKKFLENSEDEEAKRKVKEALVWVLRSAETGFPQVEHIEDYVKVVQNDEESLEETIENFELPENESKHFLVKEYAKTCRDLNYGAKPKEKEKRKREVDFDFTGDDDDADDGSALKKQKTGPSDKPIASLSAEEMDVRIASLRQELETVETLKASLDVMDKKPDKLSNNQSTSKKSKPVVQQKLNSNTSRGSKKGRKSLV